MAREFNILNVFLVLTTSISAIKIGTDSQKTLSVTDKRLNKCCPAGEYVGKKKACLKYNDTLSFSTMKIYDKELISTGKSLEDVFELIPRKFENETFRRDALDVTMLDFNIYLTESGVLKLELPNAYQRWFPIPQREYCIDHRIMVNQTEITPRFWAILPSEEFTESSIYVTFATIVSCFFLLLVLIVHCLLPELQNMPGKIMMAQVSSLFMTFMLMAVIQIKSYTKEACVGLTLAFYFFFMASFFWMNVLSINIWCDLRSMETPKRSPRIFRFLMYCLYAWGVPLAMTLGLAVLNTMKDTMRRLPWFVTPRIPEYGCFLQGGVKLLYLYVPMLILNLCNWIFFLMIIIHIWGVRRFNQGPSGTTSSKKQIYKLYRKLAVVMGLNWLLEIVNFVYPSLKIWYLSDAYNIFIGFALFYLFVCKKRIFRKLCQR